MSRRLQPCPSCAQHVRAGEIRCPFCEAALPAGFGARISSGEAVGRPMSRAALLFFGATAAAACGGQPQTSTPSDGRAQASTASDGGGEAAASNEVDAASSEPEASSDGATDASADTFGPQTYWDNLPPEPAASMAAYGPAAIEPMSVSHYGPGPIDPGTAVNYGPAVTAEPSPTAAAMYGPAVVDTQGPGRPPIDFNQ